MGAFGLIAQFHVPVGKIDKVLPEVVLWRSKGDLDKRPPLRALRFADETHVGFAREPVAFARIARDAGAHHVFPRGRPAPVAGHDVIQI